MIAALAALSLATAELACGDLAVVGHIADVSSTPVGSELLEDDSRLWTYTVRVDRVVRGEYAGQSLRARRIHDRPPEEAQRLFLLRRRADGAFDVVAVRGPTQPGTC